jgi:hypothetical protein
VGLRHTPDSAAYREALDRYTHGSAGGDHAQRSADDARATRDSAP